MHMSLMIKFLVNTIFQLAGLLVGDSSPSVITSVNSSLMMDMEVVELDILKSIEVVHLSSGKLVYGFLQSISLLSYMLLYEGVFFIVQ